MTTKIGAQAALYSATAEALRTAKLDINAALTGFAVAVQKQGLLDALQSAGGPR